MEKEKKEDSEAPETTSPEINEYNYLKENFNEKIDLETFRKQKHTVLHWSLNGYIGGYTDKPGAGKTFTGCLAIASYIDAFTKFRTKPLKILVITPTIVIKNAWIERYITHPALVGMYWSDPKVIIDVVVINTVSASINYDQYSKYRGYDLFIFDEIHKYINGEIFSSVLDYCKEAKKHRLFLSGTVSQKELSNLKDRYGMPCFLNDQADNKKKGIYNSPIILVKIRMTEGETKKYDEFTNAIRKKIAYLDLSSGESYYDYVSNKNAIKIKRKSELLSSKLGQYIAAYQVIKVANDILMLDRQKDNLLGRSMERFLFIEKLVNKLKDMKLLYKIITFNQGVDFIDNVMNKLPKSFSYHSNPKDWVKYIGVDNPNIRVNEVVGYSQKVTTKVPGGKSKVSKMFRYKRVELGMRYPNDSEGKPLFNTKAEMMEYYSDNIKVMSGATLAKDNLDLFVKGLKFDIVNSQDKLSEGFDSSILNIAVQTYLENSFKKFEQRYGRIGRKDKGVFIQIVAVKFNGDATSEEGSFKSSTARMSVKDILYEPVASPKGIYPLDPLIQEKYINEISSYIIKYLDYDKLQ